MNSGPASVPEVNQHACKFINPRRACAGGLQSLSLRGCVCVSVCLSVKSHLTSGASVRPENT